MQSVSGLTGPLGLELNVRIITEEKNEHKIIEAAQRQINEDEAQLIENTVPDEGKKMNGQNETILSILSQPERT